MAAVANEIERGNAVSPQATSSPSMMQERERRRANVSTISGKRSVSVNAVSILLTCAEVKFPRRRNGDQPAV